MIQKILLSILSLIFFLMAAQVVPNILAGLGWCGIMSFIWQDEINKIVGRVINRSEYPFDEINQALESEFGPGIVITIKDFEGYAYALRFLEENPTDETIDKATAIFNGFVPTAWDYDYMNQEREKREQTN